MTREEFKLIYDQYFDAIRRYLYYRSGNAELSSDIAQEAFVKVWEKQFEYQEKGTKSLLYKIAIDLLISHFRREKVSSDYMQEFKFQYDESDQVDELEFKELKELYEKALLELPEKQRDVFLMSRVEALTYKDIAERLDISVKAVEKRISSALAKLKLKMNVS